MDELVPSPLAGEPVEATPPEFGEPVEAMPPEPGADPAALDQSPKSELRTLELSAISLSEDAQPRVKGVEDWRVDEYFWEMKNGAKFPPLDVFQDGGTFWLGDGFHRYHALIKLKCRTVKCLVHPGGLRAAILHSCGANALHGFRRRSEDKRRAVNTLLKDLEWWDWSDNKIAQTCNVSNHLVAKIRATLAPPPRDEKDSRPQSEEGGHLGISQDGRTGGAGSSQDAARRVRKASRGGVVYEQDTTNIGRSRTPEPRVENRAPAPSATPAQSGLFDNHPVEKPAATPVPQSNPLEERWQAQFKTFGTTSSSLIREWDREFPGWRKFSQAPHFLTIAEGAARAWTEVAEIMKGANRWSPAILISLICRT